MQLSHSIFISSIASAALLTAGCGSNTIQTGNNINGTAYTGTTLYLASGSTTAAAVLAFQSGGSASITSGRGITLPPGTVAQYIATDPTGDVYVTTSSDVREYSGTASGAATPLRVLPLNATTTLNAMITGLAADGSGNIYVSEATGSVAIFNSSANGSVAPTRIIAGANTTLVNPFQLAVDGTGNLYVMNFIGAGSDNILVFAPTATGNIAPIRTLNLPILGFTVNTAGNIYTASTSGVEIYAAGASGSPSPTQTISNTATGQASLTGGIAVDSAGNIYIATLGTLNTTVIPASASVEQFSNVSGTITLTNTFTPGPWVTASEPLDLIAVH